MRTNSLLLFLIALLCFQACKKIDKEPVKDQTQIPQDVIDKIKAQGFSTRNVLQTKDGYIVEGDIFFSAKALNEITPSLDLRIGKTEQYRTLNVVTGLPRVITISITNLPAHYTTALDSAIARFNVLNLRLTFTRVASNADIAIDYEWIPNTLTYSTPPTPDGNPGNVIKFNSSIIAEIIESELITLFTHEIGHAIGFRHTDFFNRPSCIYGVDSSTNEGQGSAGAIHIPGTPGTIDPNSWMLACSWANRPFTGNDIKALTYMYGTPANIPIAGGPAAAYRKGTGILDVFARSSNYHLLHKMWTAQMGWSGWVDLGGNITDGPAVISRTASTIDVFARGDSSNLVHRRFSDTIGWSNWENLGGNIASAPAVASRADYLMNVFARSYDYTLLHLGWNDHASGWESWEDLGGDIVDGPAAVSRQFISINIFARGTNNHLMHKSWSDGVGWGWSAWEDLGGYLSSAPAVVSRTYTNMNIFARGYSNNLMHLFWNGSGSGWGTWENLGGILSAAPTVTSQEVSSLNVFAKGTSNNLVHIKWHESTGWASWQYLQ